MIWETVAGDFGRFDYAATGNKVVGCAWLTSLLQLDTLGKIDMNSVQYRYKAAVDRWVDGDTVDLYVDLGFHIYAKTRFRLYGIDTPERGHELWREATNHAEHLAPVGADIVIDVYKAPDKYGRWLAKIYVGEESVGDSLIAAGLAAPYYGGPRAWDADVHAGLAAEYVGEAPKA